MTSIGQNIKTFREIRNLSREHLAETLDISLKTYSKIENNETSPTFKTLQDIAKVLDVELTDLIKFNPAQIFNNYHQQGNYIANNYNNISDNIEQLYQKLLKEKDDKIELLNRMLRERQVS